MTATALAVERPTTTGRASGRGPSPGVLVPLALVLVAGGLRVWGLDAPERLYFDEKYYAVDALDYLRRGVEEGRPVHPPLGKWLIAAGIEVVGDHAAGWRAASAVAGTLTVLVTYLLGRRLTGSVALAGLAGLLVAVDGLAFTASRIAMLDAFLALFVVTAVWLVVLDGQARRARPGGARAALLGSRWRWLAGLVLGLAVATKWSGLLAVLACGLLVLMAEARLPVASRRLRADRALLAAAGMVLAFVVLPLVVHLASYAGWFAHYEKSYAGARACGDVATCDHGPGERLATWAGFQAELVAYHGALEATHPYRSSPAGWPLLLRPVLQYRESCPSSGPPPDQTCVVEPGRKATILGVGNPALWWPALLAYPVLAWRAVRRREPAPAVALVTLLALWLPWFAAGKPGYLFYLVPAVPFVALALVLAVGAVSRPPTRRRLLAGVAAAAVVLFSFFHPVLTGAPLSTSQLELRTWLPGWD